MTKKNYLNWFEMYADEKGIPREERWSVRWYFLLAPQKFIQTYWEMEAK